MKLLQINSLVSSGSTGRIVEDLGKTFLLSGNDSYVAAANNTKKSLSNVIKIGNKLDQNIHGIKTRLLDLHGFGSKVATLVAVEKIIKLKPDIIHLHNLHGYYINIKILFDYLKKSGIPIVWTLHDCWPFTGHCAHYERVNCYRWQKVCYDCPNKKRYPASYFRDNSTENFYQKKDIFSGVNNLRIVTPSKWLAGEIKQSFLGQYPVIVINNGINLNIFNYPDNNLYSDQKQFKGKNVLLSVANTWKMRDGLEDLIELGNLVSEKEQIVLIGLDTKQIDKLPANIIGLRRTENPAQLAALYAEASVFINPTYVDTFPSTNLESLACGTPVVTYNTGGSPEAINGVTGFVVDKGDIMAVLNAVNIIIKNGKEKYSSVCRKRAEALFNMQNRYNDYMNLYFSMMK